MIRPCFSLQGIHRGAPRLLAAFSLLCGCSAEPEPPASATLSRMFPEHAAAVLAGRAAFVPDAEGYRLDAAEATRGSASRLDVVLPRTGSEPIRFRTPAGTEVRVREQGAAGEAVALDRAVAYRRAGGTSFWTATERGAEEWLLLEEGVARGDDPVAAWHVEGATPRARGALVELVGELSGVPLVRVSAPRAYAASGRPVPVALRVRGSRIELSVDAGGEAVLADPVWEPADSMSVKRVRHTATLLPSGQVLVVGGEGPGIYHSSAELYDDPDRWTPTTWMERPRSGHTATLLPSGQVLVVGGYEGFDFPKPAARGAELYDPLSETWIYTARMKYSRVGHTATLLPNGKVLVAGGSNGDTVIARAELYDPEKDTWTFTTRMQAARDGHTATRLSDGKVLIAGKGTPTELYDPERDRFTSTGPMHVARSGHTATLLPGGEVLVAGGYDSRLDPLDSAELYDPETGAWAVTSIMSSARSCPAAALLPSGQVLMTGGAIGARRLYSAELYDPETGAWTPTIGMKYARCLHTATLLPGGPLLVAGGIDGPLPALASAERFVPILGDACKEDAHCPGGSFCVDGICCDAPCPCGECSFQGQCGPRGSPTKAGMTCAPATCAGAARSLAPAVCELASAACPEPEHVDCIAYRCDPERGACKTTCDSMDDCATGFVCNLRRHCVRPPPAPSAASGCSAAPGPSPSAAARGFGLSLLGLGAARRRRRAAAVRLAHPRGAGRAAARARRAGASLLYSAASVFMPLPSSRSRRAARQSSWLAAALLLGGCGSEPEDTSAAALRQRFPAQADAVLSAREAFAVSAGGFRLAASEPGGAWVRSARPEVELPSEGSGVIRFRLAGGGEIRVRELGAAGEGAMAEGAVSYRRAGGTSFWTATEGGVEEWLLLEAGVARGGEVVAAWEVEGAQLRARGAAVELVDEARGAPVLRVTAPRAHAASGRAVAPALRVRGARIELSVDMGDAVGEAVLVDPAWEPAGTMNVARKSHAATLMADGRVLVTGGAAGELSHMDSVEVYDPATDTWTLAAPMRVSRVGHTATLLPNGKILAAGLDGGRAELYDPAIDAWTFTARMQASRIGPTATRLPSGEVLVAGGDARSPPVSSAELYDPTTDTWRLTLPMRAARREHSATLLDDGRVLVAGGRDPEGTLLDSAEVYDPVTDGWTSTGPMVHARASHPATQLPDGKVLVVGGWETDGERYDNTEVYDPITDRWTASAPMIQARRSPSATLLSSGRVLAVSNNRVAELYDPIADRWTGTEPPRATHDLHTATLLKNGHVLVAGPSNRAERYTGVGSACASDADCVDAPCVDGVCCDSPCTEACHTCARSSSLGHCVPQPKGSDTRNDCALVGCDGACDGFGSCAAVRQGDTCIPNECGDETHSLASIECPAGGVVCPDPATYARASVDCVPYRCDRASGRCKERCRSVQDCAPGHACNFSGECVRPPPVVEPGGCSAARATAASSGGDLVALLLALLAVGTRRSSALRVS
ncbi:kelch repeat-containing protein [Sorangium sp. So ce260]|uniref:kelch repeat-containing protein n=1 Tax=Sorangium sp. So ce260 TaxID=3133291 RepID=UPI003F6342E7